MKEIEKKKLGNDNVSAVDSDSKDDINDMDKVTKITLEDRKIQIRERSLRAKTVIKLWIDIGKRNLQMKKDDY